jgi:hypothetical protein
MAVAEFLELQGRVLRIFSAKRTAYQPVRGYWRPIRHNRSKKSAFARRIASRVI